MDHLTAIVPYASLLAVVVAIVFGILTLRQWHRTRYLTAAAELVRTIQTEQFNRAIARLLELPEEAPAERFASDRELVAAVTTVAHVFESLGVLAYNRVLELRLVDQLVGGYVRTIWPRLKPYVESRRADFGAMFAEWFQWLAEQLAAHPAYGKREGAHVAFRDWRP
jgi:hypothetical protein